MSKIILRIQKKRYKGTSTTGKSHNFLTSNNGGTYFSIPKKAVEQIRYYTRPYGDSELLMMEIVFENWATKLGEMGAVLEGVLNQMIVSPDQVIR